jgi:hypothetical protein
MQRIKNSWELGKISWSVLKSDRTLVWFPILSLLASLVVLGVVVGLLAATGVDGGRGRDSLEPIGYVFIFAGYVAWAFISAYFLGALVFAANRRLNGERTDFSDAISAATGRIHRLLPWAFVQATVSVIIRALEDRGWLGYLVARLLGTAWAVLTFLTIPIIMLEDLGPVAALKRSGELVKRSWGENLSAQIGFGLLGFVAALPGAVLLALGVGSGSTAVAIVLGGIGVIWFLIVGVVIAAMSGIFQTALYRFAVDGTAPPAFADAELGEVFQPKREQGGGLFG